jgi:GxxExxY protein
LNAESRRRRGAEDLILTRADGSRDTPFEIYDVSGAIVDAAIEVHKELGGPGLLENVYEEALAFELEERGFRVERQVCLPIIYKGHRIASDLRLDLLVERSVVVECKATTIDSPVFEAQALTYLRVANLKLALVINFGKRRVVNGIRRIVNGL